MTEPDPPKAALAAVPGFWQWAWPTMLAWGFLWAVALIVLLDEGFGNSGRPDGHAGLAVLGSYLIMPILASLYLTAFLTGLSVHRKSTAPGKALNFVSVFAVSRIADIWLLIGLYIASAYLLYWAFASKGLLIFLAPAVGGLSVGVCTWLMHRYWFGQSPGSGRRWLVAHVRGFLYALLLLIVAIVATVGLPASLQPAACLISLAILPLPHLFETYRVWRRHYEAERRFAESLILPHRYIVVAGMVFAAVLLVEWNDPGGSRIALWEVLRGRTYF